MKRYLESSIVPTVILVALVIMMVLATIGSITVLAADYVKPVTPVEPGKPAHCDNNKGVQGNLVAPNDNTGPGPNTNSPVPAGRTSAGMTEEEYWDRIAEMNFINGYGLKAVAYKMAHLTHMTIVVKDVVYVDDNGPTGVGYGSIDDPTPITPSLA